MSQLEQVIEALLGNRFARRIITAVSGLGETLFKGGRDLGIGDANGNEGRGI